MLTTALLSFFATTAAPTTATPYNATTSAPAATTVAKTEAPARTTRLEQKKNPRPIRDLDGVVIGDESEADIALGGNYYNPLAGQASGSPYLYGTWQVSLNDTGTGWQENFVIGLPRSPQWPIPLLVAFHGWGNTEKDIVLRTKFFQKAMARGWAVVAPLGAHKFNQCIDYSQTNTEAVLDWVTSHFAIDSERVYGVGFSMGGGNASAYAARHLDPDHARFAAVVDHTGSVSIRDVWTHANDKSLLENPLMFGGSPTAYPFRYASASVIDLDSTGWIDPAADLARNLVRTPIRMFGVTNDPNAHLITQTTDFHGYLTGLGGTPELQINSGSTHSWSTLDEDQVLDWLSTKSWTEPAFGTPVKVLADRDARWYHFAITKANANAFAPFRWTVDAANNRIVVDQIQNVSSIRFAPSDIGLPDDQVEVMVNCTSTSNVELVLENYPVPPSTVTRTGSSGATWTHDPVAKTVTLHETIGTGYPRWTVIK